MPTPQCLDNIEKQPPPYNFPCTPEFCMKTRDARDQHCIQAGLPPNTPILLWDPNINSPCYCCCYCCSTLGTPIAVSKKDFAFIQDIRTGNEVMTTGLDLVWKPGIVQFRSGGFDPKMIPGLYLLRYILENENEYRQLIVAADQLFLMAGDKTLKKVQNLIPNDGLLAADGATAHVVFVTRGEYNTAIQSIEMKGDFDGTELKGHLLNFNGIVSTDFKVQAWYAVHENAPSWENDFPDKSVILSVGDPDYIEKFNCKEIDDFLDDPDSWPTGFMPVHEAIMNVPVNAKRFLTDKQADEVDANGHFNPLSSPQDSVEKILNMYRINYPEIDFTLDWHNDSPNAFSWISNSKQYVLIAGKLARLQNLNSNGISLIVADLISRIVDQNCVAEGDYEALNIMRLVWPNSILATMAPEGIKEVDEVVFSLIKKNRQRNPDRICDDPGIDCRTESFRAGLSFFPMPKCGIPHEQVFKLDLCYPDFMLIHVSVIFNDVVDEVTGSSVNNYFITEGIIIKKAVVDSNEVVLTVEGLIHGRQYVLQVDDVKSVYDVLIQPNPSLTILSVPRQ